MFFYEMHRYFLFRKRMMRRAFTAIFITLRLCSVPSGVSCLCPDLQIHPNIPVKRRIKSLKLRTLSLLANLLSKGELNMKATGIVRRIDSSVIIGAKVRSLENTGFSLIFVQFHQYPKP